MDRRMHEANGRPVSAPHEPLWKPHEAAAFLGVSARTVRRLAAAHLIPCVRIGGQLRFEPADVLRFVAARKE